MSYVMSGVSVRNRLDDELTDVTVVYGQSNKGVTPFDYATDWREVDVELSTNILTKESVIIGDVKPEKSSSTKHPIPFRDDTRGYWQVYFTYRGSRYRINKNNAQVNVWPQDRNQMAEISIRMEGQNIRLDFVLNSGNAYFYAVSYC